MIYTIKQETDGRHRRSVRTQTKVIDALLKEIKKQQKVPTIGEVARRADCSHRTVAVRFGDVNGLGLAAFDTVLDQRRTMAWPDELPRGRRERITLHIALRSRLAEQWHVVWRVVLAASACNFGRERIERALRLLRQELEMVYASELAPLTLGDRAAVLVTLETVLNLSVWDRMRRFDGLSPKEAEELWIVAVDRLLPSA